jgi:hypothetical protein
VPPRAMFTILLCTLICIYVAQITCICFVCVLGVVWVLRSVEIVVYRACIERVHRRVTYKLFSTLLIVTFLRVTWRKTTVLSVNPEITE